MSAVNMQDITDTGYVLSADAKESIFLRKLSRY